MKCWRPCWNRSDAAGRCPDCLETLTYHRDAAVRTLLVSDPAITVETLRVLATDANALVAMAAQERLDALAPGLPQTTPTTITNLDEEW